LATFSPWEKGKDELSGFLCDCPAHLVYNVSMASVELQHIAKHFDKNVIVPQLSLTAQSGEFLVLVGPSGCGKSTVLRMIAGLEAPTQGDIFIDGINVTAVAPKDRDIAMVFQNYALYPHMSVWDNMAFGLKMRKTPKAQITQQVTDAAKILDLEDLLKRKPKQLSGGQRQRVALGRALVRNPKVFLMDEPLSNLDAKLRIQMRAEIIRLQRRLKATTIYVTHDQVEAMTMGDRIAVLNKGVLQQLDTPLMVYQRPANQFVATFMGQMNLLTLTPAPSAQQWLLGQTTIDPADFDQALAVPLPQPNQPVLLGFRPEHVSLSPLPHASSITLSLVPTLYETLGSETWVHATWQDQALLLKLAADVVLPPLSTPTTIWVNLAGVSWFSAPSGQRLG
jgi:ABC-type sugar transport system ATPase subunit